MDILTSRFPTETKLSATLILSVGKVSPSGDQNPGPEDAVGDADVVAPLQEGLELQTPAHQRNHVAPGTTVLCLL